MSLHDFDIQAQRITGGQLAAADNGAVRFTSDAQIEADFLAGGKLSVSAQGALTNSRTLEAGETIRVEATHIENTASGIIQANNQATLNSQSLANRGLINSNGQTLIQTQALLENIGAGRIYGNHIAIEAGQLTNREEGNKAGTVAARARLDIGAGRIENREGAILASEGGLAIGGALDGARHATGRTQALNNASAQILSGGDMWLAYEQLTNTNLHFRVGEEEVPGSRQHIVEYRPEGSSSRIDSSQIANIKNEETLYTVDGKKIEDYTKYDYQRYQTQTAVLESAPGQIIAGGLLQLDGTKLTNDKSQILANGILGEVGSVHNIDAQGTLTTIENGTSRYHWVGWNSTGTSHQSKWKSPAAYHPADAIEHVSLNVMQYNAHAAGNAPGKAPGITRIEAQAGEARTLNAQQLLPAASWFTIHLDNGNHPLIETDPAYTQNRAWASSDILLDGLGLNLEALLKRLGDGYYEQRLVAEQIARLTGKARLEGYADNESQFLALMANALIEAQSLNLIPGVALNPAQLARLTRDIVWMVEQAVTLPDGSRTQALVPQVYTVAQAGSPDGAHSMVAANAIQLKVEELVNNAALVGHDTVSLSGQDLHNTGGLIQGNIILAQAEGDITNTGGQIIGGQAVLLQAGHDIASASTTQATENIEGQSRFSAVNIDQTATLLATAPDGQLLLQAGNDIQLNASIIASAGSIGLLAGGDIHLGAVQVSRRDHTVGEAWEAGNTANARNTDEILSARSAEVGTLIQAQGDISLISAGSIEARAAEIDSAAGAISLQAAKDIALEAGRELTEERFTVRTEQDGAFSHRTTLQRDESQGDFSLSSNITGLTVQLAAGQDISVSGSNIISDEATTLLAGRDIRIAAAQDAFSSLSETVKTTSGLMGTGGIGFTVGEKVEQATLQESALSHTPGMLGSLAGDTLVVAGERYRQTGSLVSSPQGDVGILAQQIDISAAQNRYTSDYLYQYDLSGLTVALNVPVIDMVRATAASYQDAGKSKNDRVNAMSWINAGWNTWQAANALAGAMQGTGQGASSGVSISITYGEQHNRMEEHIEGFTASASQVSAGGIASLTATGAGEASNITVIGSDIAGLGGTALEADNAIHLLAARQGQTEESSNQSWGFNAGVAIAFGDGASLGFTIGGNYGHGAGDGEETTWRNTHVGDAHSQTTLTSGGETTLKGAQILGQGIKLDAASLTIESLQDTYAYKGEQQNVQAQVTIGYGFSGSLSYSQSKIDADYASVTEQSGIKAGDDGYQVNVTGHTNLTGALITSTQAAEDAGKNSFMTATLAARNLANVSEYSGTAFGVGLGYADADANHALYGGKDTKATFGKAVGYGRDSEHDASVTKSGINTANIAVTDKDAQQARTGQSVEQTLASVATHITTDTAAEKSGALGNNFDKDRVQKELDLQVRVTQEFDRTRQAAKAQLNGRIDALKSSLDTADPAQYAEILEKIDSLQTLGLLLDSVSMGLYAPTDSLGGSLAAAASPFAAKAIGEYFANHPGQEAAHALAHAALAAAVAAAGGNDALTAGVAAGSAEAAAPLLAHWLYGTSDPAKLDATQKNTLANILGLIGTGIGASTGDVANAANASMLAHNAVENNFLTTDEARQFEKELKKCKAKGDCTEVVQKYINISNKHSEELRKACSNGITCAGMEELIVAHASTLLQDEDARAILARMNAPDIIYLAENVSKTDRALAFALDPSNWILFALSRGSLARNASAKEMLVGASISGAFNAGVQYLATGQVSISDTVIATILGAITANGGYRATVTANGLGGYTAASINGDDPYLAALFAWGGAHIGFKAVSGITNKYYTISGQYKTTEIGTSGIFSTAPKGITFSSIAGPYKARELGATGILETMPPSIFPSVFGNMGKSFVSELLPIDWGIFKSPKNTEK